MRRKFQNKKRKLKEVREEEQEQEVQEQEQEEQEQEEGALIEEEEEQEGALREEEEEEEGAAVMEEEEEEEVVKPVKKQKTSENGTKEKGSKKKTEQNGEKHTKKEKKGKTSVEENGATSQDGKAPFSSLRISPEALKKLEEKGFKEAFAIQVQTFDPVYDGKDVIAKALTGSGKTLAFALPTIERMRKSWNPQSAKRGRSPQVIVLAPTRELVKQIAAEFVSLGSFLSTLCVYGGTKYDPQISALRQGADVIVGTPGRIIDLLNQGILKLDAVNTVILDEADEMLDLGFADSIEKVLTSLPDVKKTQILLFSATVPDWVLTIAKKYQKPDKVTVDLIVGNNRTPNQVRHLAVFCSLAEKQHLLADIIQVYGSGQRSIVFTNTKALANELALNSSIRNICEVLHGDIAQEQREITMSGFRGGKFNCLVATDVASRGLDISGVDLIVQCQPPSTVETYIHRSGRTGRAGRTGTVITFFTKREAQEMSKFESRIGVKFQRIGAPQPQDVVKASAQSVALSLFSVDPENILLYKESAEKLIEEKGAVEALAAALAKLAGQTKKIFRRSLLSSTSTHTTVHVKSHNPILSPAYALQLLGRANINSSSVGEVGLCMDGSAVLDVHNDVVKELLKASGTAGFECKEATEIPELKEKPQRLGGRDGGRGDSRGGWGGSGRGGRVGWGGGGGDRGGRRSSWGGDSGRGGASSGRGGASSGSSGRVGWGSDRGGRRDGRGGGGGDRGGRRSSWGGDSGRGGGSGGSGWRGGASRS